MALIIDSPWIPGYLGLKHMDYFLDPELWFQSNLKIHREFPDIIFVPSWWMEYGMAAEPSALGAKIKFWQDNTPSEYHTLYHIEDMDLWPDYEVEADAFMGMTLHRIRMQRQRILDTGEILPLVTSRGPMCTAGFVRSTTDFMIDLVEKPEWAHKLLDLCTSLIIDWLKAQQKAMGPTVEGIFILDDIVGFVNEEHYLEFAHPYLKRICDAFPKDWVKIYHNDAEITACLDHLPDAGFNVLNWGKQTDIAEVKQRVGEPDVPDGERQPARGRRARHARGGAGRDAGRAGEERRRGDHPLGGRRHQPGDAAREHRGDAAARWRNSTAAGARRRCTPEGQAMPDYALMNQCLYEGKAADVERMTREALAEGRSVQEVLTEGLIAGMSVVGEDFKHNILYVPEVLIAARAMKAGMAVLKPLLTARDSDVKPAGVLLMGTVRGDLHDIGKNLVCMMAEGAGFEVHDIGVDQSIEKFLAAAEQFKPDIIGMSALLTTTMTYMKVVIDGFKERGLGHIKMAIGGAPISQMYAEEIGADGYGADASSAVDLFLRLVAEKKQAAVG